MTYLVIFLFIVICILGWVITNLLNQVRQLEANFTEISNVADKIETTHYNTIVAVLKLVNQAKADMDRIDYRGAFKTDDEVGFTFKALQTIVDTLAEELNKLKEE